jgi:hypothetical protein
VGGLVLTLILVVLDKAGKLKGQVLYWLLALAALMTLPLVLGNPFVAEASALWKYWLRACSVSVVVLGFWAIGIWISTNPVDNPPKPRPPILPNIANDKTPHKSPQVPPLQPSVKEQPPKIIIETGPVFGNIKERAIALSDEILIDLYRHGWPGYGPPRIQPERVVQQFPGSDSAKTALWVKTRSGYFRFRLRDRVIDIRNEFAQLHLRSQELDEFLDHEKRNDDFEKQMAALPPQNRVATPDIFPPQIESVAKELRVLAEQIK